VSAPLVGVSKLLPGQFDLLASALSRGCRFLEMGTLFGATAARRADAEPAAQILSLDTFREIGPEHWRANRRANMTLFIGTAQELEAFSRHGQFDAIFVDADHRYDGVRADLASAGHLLRPGGRLFAHDYGPPPNWKWPGVTRAVDEFCALYRLKIVARAGSLVEIGP
jgi:predicted O-methyltransferase YrrM